MLHLLEIIIIGCAAGVAAKLIMPVKDQVKFWISVALGAAGALLADLLGRMTGWYKAQESIGFVAAAVGSIILLVIYRFIRKAQSKA